MTAPVRAHPKRSDAVRNRGRVLAAAESLFSQVGLKAAVEDVAREANVGVGTVCRNFPTKQALVEAVLASMYESLLVDARAALGDVDPAAGFGTFVTALSEFQSRHRVLAEQMAAAIDLPEAPDPLRRQLQEAITELVARAQSAGAIRHDVGPADLAVLLAGVAHATALVGDLGSTLRQRYVSIVLDGLRPLDPTPLVGRPLDFDALRRLRQPRR